MERAHGAGVEVCGAELLASAPSRAPELNPQYSISPHLPPGNRLAMAGTGCVTPPLRPQVTVLPVAIAAPDAPRPCKVTSSGENN